MDRNTLVVNFFAGAGAGKTTCAWAVAAELNKLNILTEYVPEYAKELVWDNQLHLLDGSFINQMAIFEEQKHRIDRLVGKVDVIVTDSPLLQSVAYIQENAASFEKMAVSTHGEYHNVNLYINRGKEYEQAGRIHTLEESKAVDREIRGILSRNRIVFKDYYHQTIPAAIRDIQTTLRKLQEKSATRFHKENDKSKGDMDMATDTRALATEIVDFLEANDPAFGYAGGQEGWEREFYEAVINTVDAHIRAGDGYDWLDIVNANQEVRGLADALKAKLSAFHAEEDFYQDVPQLMALIDYANNDHRNTSSMLYALIKDMTIPADKMSEFNRHYRGLIELYGIEPFVTSPIRAAVLQPSLGIEKLRGFLSYEEFKNISATSNDYDVVYNQAITNDPMYVQGQEADFADTLFLRSQTGELDNRYGRSISVGDVIVFADGNNVTPYYVDTAGFVELPVDFISRKTHGMISCELDIMAEREGYAQISELAGKNGYTGLQNAVNDLARFRYLMKHPGLDQFSFFMDHPSLLDADKQKAETIPLREVTLDPMSPKEQSDMRDFIDHALEQRSANATMKLPGKSEDGIDIHQGYAVIHSMEFDDGHGGFVIGHNPDAVQPYATWDYGWGAHEGEAYRDYDSGRHFGTLERAQRDFMDRVKGELIANRAIAPEQTGTQPLETESEAHSADVTVKLPGKSEDGIDIHQGYAVIHSDELEREYKVTVFGREHQAEGDPYYYTAGQFTDHAVADAFAVLLENDGFDVTGVSIVGKEDYYFPAGMTLEEAQQNIAAVERFETFLKDYDAGVPFEREYSHAGDESPEEDPPHDHYEVFVAALEGEGTYFAGALENQNDAEAYCVLLNNEGYNVVDFYRHIYDGTDHQTTGLSKNTSISITDALQNQSAVAALEDFKHHVKMVEPTVIGEKEYSHRDENTAVQTAGEQPNVIYEVYVLTNKGFAEEAVASSFPVQKDAEAFSRLLENGGYNVNGIRGAVYETAEQRYEGTPSSSFNVSVSITLEEAQQNLNASLAFEYFDEFSEENGIVKGDYTSQPTEHQHYASFVGSRIENPAAGQSASSGGKDMGDWKSQIARERAASTTGNGTKDKSHSKAAQDRD